jgi:hypothetical protein
VPRGVIITDIMKKNNTLIHIFLGTGTGKLAHRRMAKKGSSAFLVRWG